MCSCVTVWCLLWHSQSTLHSMVQPWGCSSSFTASKTVCSFCFWPISDCVTSATFSFLPDSFSVQNSKDMIGLLTQDRTAAGSGGILRGLWLSTLDGKLTFQVAASHQITSGAPVRHNSPLPGPWLWSALPPVHCWSSRSEPGDTHFQSLLLLCWSCLFWFKMWLLLTFRRSLNLRFSRDVGSNMTRSAFSSETTAQSVSVWDVMTECDRLVCSE